VAIAQLRLAFRRRGAGLEMVEHEQADGRRQIAQPAIGVQRRKPLEDKEATCRLPLDINPKSVAASFTKKRWPETRGGFNRLLEYPETGWC
jgi:hypothetical protein